jgi:hypothetical protein
MSEHDIAAAPADGAERVDPQEAATLRAANEALTFEAALLRSQTLRLTGEVRAAEARVAVATAEVERLREYVTRIERSQAWRLIQALRGLAGRRW